MHRVENPLFSDPSLAAMDIIYPFQLYAYMLNPISLIAQAHLPLPGKVNIGKNTLSISLLFYLHTEVFIDRIFTSNEAFMSYCP